MYWRLYLTIYMYLCVCVCGNIASGIMYSVHVKYVDDSNGLQLTLTLSLVRT